MGFTKKTPFLIAQKREIAMKKVVKDHRFESMS